MKHTIKKFISIYCIQSLLLFTTMACFAQKEQKNKSIISIIGTGYVGLVSGAGLAAFGNHVICADIDAQKISMLKNGIIPIYEPGLKELVDENVTAGRLSFSDNVEKAIQDADILFIAVGTPMGKDGDADMKYVDSVIASIAKNIDTHKIIVTKSTVPVGTGNRIRALLEQEYQIDGTLFTIVSNPEFLREGCAVPDFLYPDRIVIGAENESAFEIMRTVYKKPLENAVPIVCTNLQTSETIKYASNAFLATKLSFMNEVANFCDTVSADAHTVGYAMGLDKRIGKQFLQPGPGYGGSCFPKDTQALVYMAQKHGITIQTVSAAIAANIYQKTIPFKKLQTLMEKATGSPILAGKKIAVLGLAFKANTDDIRYSPSITMINNLLANGALVYAYDAAAMNNFEKYYTDVVYCNDPYQAIQNADAVVIMTEWDEFKHLDIKKISNIMKQLIILDTRNVLDPNTLKAHNFMYDTIGRSYICT